jgi:hypothetical protein
MCVLKAIFGFRECAVGGTSESQSQKAFEIMGNVDALGHGIAVWMGKWIIMRSYFGDGTDRLDDGQDMWRR